jgi:hypothetical protein
LKLLVPDIGTLEERNQQALGLHEDRLRGSDLGVHWDNSSARSDRNAWHAIDVSAFISTCLVDSSRTSSRRRTVAGARRARDWRAFQHRHALGEVKVHQVVQYEIGGATFGRAISKKTVPSIPGNALPASHYVVEGSESATVIFSNPIIRV